EYCGNWEGRIIVDDYAHHPSEVKATLDMARLIIGSSCSPFSDSPLRLVAIFQPHRYSRTAEFLESFATALSNADQILLAPIYSAGESPIPGVSSAILAGRIEHVKPSLITLVAKDYEQLIEYIKTFTRPGDLLLTMGAGDLNHQICCQLFKST
ncbi:MAG TPA: cyanophycin synthetase, partial [Prochlorococcaceae cyanobacterium AMR_MDS_5431]|nr:cyanophycin synthetase [Prochlorococcaceae cyanobacterium AMR_MDS_5431]